MAELADLEKRVRMLEEIESIRKLKFKYWWTLDHQLWDEFTECFTEDMVFDFLGNKVEGRTEFVSKVKKILDGLTTSHHGHHPDITITGEKTARATWPLRDVLVNPKLNTVFRGRAYYEEEYRKEEGVWKIAILKLSYIFATGEGRKYAEEAGLMLQLIGDETQEPTR